ncbi:glycine oxidase ThiO [Microbulbifer sp. OS29]|uniref:Glycine oxidase ThiO n=1 Tax=Microbulbifer okhotskensis TaxID=2926617 RepID=A0A9X2J6K8_9GAMM|nr:glycine oxidase ThiO [Microbulbifer okhotskensis]MCO1335504.1 glycine oxidase ThiO [Microbulbifer okhotskensis]
MTSETKAKIAIAGGGLLGRLLAWRLSQRNLDITLFEAGELSMPGGACWTAAGMISPLSELVNSEKQVYTQGLQSLNLWSDWSRLLEQQSGSAVEFRRAGSVLVAHGKDRSELVQFLRELQGKLGESAREQVQPLDAKSLAKLEPALHSFEQGLYLRGEADINNHRLLPVLLHVLRENGVKLRERTKVNCAPGRILLAQGDEAFDGVIDCRGLGAKGQIEGLRGVRGEVMVVESREVVLQRPVRLLHPRYKLYAVPRSDGRTVIGATEIESEDMSPISVRSSMELSSALYSLNPAFAEARILETRVNCRPATMDNMPVIQNEQGLIRVNGLYRHGYLLAPAVVKQVENLVAQQLLQVV